MTLRERFRKVKALHILGYFLIFLPIIAVGIVVWMLSNLWVVLISYAVGGIFIGLVHIGSDLTMKE